MTDKKDFFAKNKEFLEFLEKLAKEMGLDDSNFLRDIRIGLVDCLTTEKTDWEKCTPQQRRQHFLYWIIRAEEKKANPEKPAKIKSNEIFKSYIQQYRSDIKD